jgi:cellulose synthase/poly-beta-1,6-N-acetylglucosamine synthase-like glycosyltransferase
LSTVFYILAALLIYFSYRSFRGGIDYLIYFKQELAKGSSDFAPFATVICPCKGDEEGLKENLEKIFKQEYPAYEVVFVVDDENDPAATIIDRSISRENHPVGETPTPLLRKKGSFFAKLVVASKATDSSQKVENLREAVLHADERSEVFVFVDSDARPSTDWLRSLVLPLENENVGVATGYRWFISPKPTFASELRNVWNASIASQLGPNTNGNFCWGGSMAILRHTFEKLSIRKKWHGTLSDDFTVMRAIRDAGLEIVFVPQALTPTIDDCSFRELAEFTTRQMKITRVYAPKFWLISFFGSGLFCLVMLWSLAIVIFSSGNDLTVASAIATLLLVSALSIGKSYLRLKAIQLILGPQQDQLWRQVFPQLALWAVAPFVFLANCTAALFSRRIRWRGTNYQMVSHRETRVIGE